MSTGNADKRPRKYPRWLSSMCLRRRLSVSVYERAFFGNFRLDKEEIEEQFDNKFTNLMADEDRDLVDNFVARILEGSSAKEAKRQFIV